MPFLSILLLGVLSIAGHWLNLYLGWQWFAVPLGLPAELPIPHALGLVTIASVLTAPINALKMNKPIGIRPLLFDTVIYQGVMLCFLCLFHVWMGS